MSTAAQGLVTPILDATKVVYQFTLTRRADGSIIAEPKTAEFEFNVSEAISMMREMIAHIERQTLASQTADLVASIIMSRLASQKMMAQVQGKPM